MFVTKVSVDSDLSICSVEDAISLYIEQCKEEPIGVIVSKYDQVRAFQVAVELCHPLFITVAIDFPRDAWMIYGKEGIIYSPGA